MITIEQGLLGEGMSAKKVKILVVGAGSFGPYSRDELIAEIRKEHPDAEVVTQGTATLAQGMAFDFVAYDESARLMNTFTLCARPYPEVPKLADGFWDEKKGRRRGQRRQEKSYSWRK